MDSNYSSDGFPIRIDLGKTPDDREEPLTAEGDRKRPKKYYPTAYLSNIKGLEDLPKDGWALIRFHRSSLALQTPEEGKDGASAEIQIKEICLPEPGSEDGDLADSIAGALKDAGAEVDDGKDYEDDEGDEE